MSAPTIDRVDLTKQPTRLACGHTRAQHGTKTCEQVQAIEAIVAYAELSWHHRVVLALTGGKPAGWGPLP
jgi:hypothetical protein